jgi:hypothetical protein
METNFKDKRDDMKLLESKQKMDMAKEKFTNTKDDDT